MPDEVSTQVGRTDEITSLKLSADRARSAYENERAIELYSRALALLRGEPSRDNAALEYDVLAGRADCYSLIGAYPDVDADLARMARIAEELGDLPRQIGVVVRQIALANSTGRASDVRSVAEEALDRARAAGDRQLEADCLTALGTVCQSLSDYSPAQEYLQAALSLHRDLGNRSGEARCLLLLGRIRAEIGGESFGLDDTAQALQLFRTLGDRAGETLALSALGGATADLAQQRSYHEQALAVSEAIGYWERRQACHNNLALVYYNLGLYGRARGYAEEAVRIATDRKVSSLLSYTLETLGRTYLALGAHDQAQQALEDGRVRASEAGSRFAEGFCILGLGRVALERGEAEVARGLLQSAADLFEQVGAPADEATALSWLGAAHLALGDWPAAYASTQQAVSFAETLGRGNIDNPLHAVWWSHYTVLKADPVGTHRDQAREALEHAWTSLLEGIATLSDEGLRRNYLNKVATNRSIVLEWAREAASRGIPLDMKSLEAPEQ